jgi:hypothetical protein
MQAQRPPDLLHVAEQWRHRIDELSLSGAMVIIDNTGRKQFRPPRCVS